ncbi:MAG: MFS transporter [Tenuifilaceae bacterium]|jgi:predicted MFS family arabinose efflux permease|nr:MFS transporter [Tenuifilaceae bacterium]
MQNSPLHNIIRLYIIKASKWFMLIMPIVVLFYHDNGLGMQEVFILQAIYSISIVALEIPSGYFADALGRRNTLIMGSILGFAGYVVYSFSFGFWGFLVAEVVLGFGQSLISGADSALLYDTLKQHNREKEYMKHEGRMISAGNFAEALAGIAGGLLAAISLRYPYYFQSVIAFAAVPAAFTLVEPKIHEANVKITLNKIMGVVRFALIDNKRLRWNIIYSSVVGASTLTMAWFVQPWFIRANLSVSLFGVLWTLLNLSVGLTALFAYRFERLLGVRATVLGLTFTLGLGFLGAALFESLWGLIFLFLFYLARGVATPVLKDYINRITSSDVRATILSIRNFVIRIIFALWGPFYGWYTDAFSLTGAILIAGMVFVVLSGITYIFFIKTNFPRTKDLNE